MKETIKIDGMMCEHCVKRVTNALTAVAGVKSAAVSLENGSAEVEFDGDLHAALKAAIEDAGYDVVE